MGCSVQKQTENKHKQRNLEINLQRQIEESIQKQQQQTLGGDQEELSIYDKSLEKQVKVPKLRQPIYNTIVQRRRIQKYDDIVK